VAEEWILVEVCVMEVMEVTNMTDTKLDKRYAEPRQYLMKWLGYNKNT
jgi:hypothetical protein